MGGTYSVGSVDVGAPLEVLEHFVQVPRPGSSQEARVTITLQQTKQACHH